ncbi:MAG: SUMF1/EgtB/PvdO family nonheme iron enzyme [Polyangiaceae bacterium]|nr:SUMF1/EgtB/PvdO family nonheme iron enzyme [Polyangiaceae bacterium]
MARVRGACIDKTEVSRRSYAAFLKDSATLDRSKLPAVCQNQPSLVPDAACEVDATKGCGAACDQHPQTCVTWCNAAAYCAQMGKSLCGGTDGSLLEGSATEVLRASYWVAVCGDGVTSAAGATVQTRRQYCYGDQKDEGRCNIGPASNCPGGKCQSEAVGSRSGCRIPEADVFDLTGNAEEWLFMHDPVRDVYFSNAVSWSDGLVTKCAELGSAPLNVVLPSIGFRCCAQ